jgi:hypothetical protein
VAIEQVFVLVSFEQCSILMFNSSSADAKQYSQLTALLNKTPLSLSLTRTHEHTNREYQAEIRWENNRDNQQVKV